MGKVRRLPILVTGATGYLGREIMATCQSRDLPVIGMGRNEDADLVVDLGDERAVQNALQPLQLSAIIHAAAIVPQSLQAYEDRAAARASTAMAETIARAARHLDVPVTLVSSMTVYPADAANPVTEGAAGGVSSSAYAGGKLAAEQAVRAAGVQGFAARIPGLFGGTRPGGLVSGLKAALQAGETPRLPDAPLQWAAMSVTDAATAITALATMPATGFQPVNVGYAGQISITLLAEIAAGIFGCQIDDPIVHPVFEYDLSRWTDLTGTPPRSFEQAIRDFMT